MNKIFGNIKTNIKEFNNAVAKGDGWVKASLLVMGMGYVGRKQYARAVIVTLLQIVENYLISYSL